MGIVGMPARLSATISLGVTLSKICAGCGARCSARGELCAQCQREQVNWKAKQNKAILKSRKLHKPPEESTMQALYNCKPEPENHFRITKFDNDLNPTSTYVLTENTCECPQAHAKSCRHRKMLPFFKQEGHIGDGYFFVWETHQWYRPTGIFAQGSEEQKVIIQEPLITPDPPKVVQLTEEEAKGYGFTEEEILGFPKSASAQPPTPKKSVYRRY